MQLYSVNAGYFKLDGGAMFGVVPKSLWKELNPPDENNMCSWAMRCLLIQDGNKLILVDNGMGNKQSDKFFGFYYLHGDDNLEKSLKKYGFGMDDITDVFLTHLHFDHCGGSIKFNAAKTGYATAFKNAQYWSNEKHWNWATHPNAREKASFLKENILPIQESGQLKFTKEGETPLGFEIKEVYGHTEAMMLPMVKYKNTTIAYMADLIPSVGHIPIPYVMAYDMRPLETIGEKEKMLSKAAENNWLLFFEHDPKIECCSLQNTERGIRMKDVIKISEV
ncbi:MAG TPA: MBL fold metallo-hydrolase [Bacteroidia bacterium]|jgi:glyoxylase-like metal-dependent hydrolase (beta-lactamase superfamily II)|nr:MBL fold metallo-hydrolase [Bacteroidia bacterium]